MAADPSGGNWNGETYLWVEFAAKGSGDSASVTAPVTRPAKGSDVLSGWNYSAGNETLTLSEDGTAEITEDTVFTAVWVSGV